MRSTAFAIVLVSAASASASTYFNLDVLVSTDDFNFNTFVNVEPGANVYVRFRASFENETGFTNWGGTTLSQLDVAGSAAGDSVSNFAGSKLAPSTQTFGLLDLGQPTARLDRTDLPVGSISLGQLPVDQGGVTDNPIDIFKFNYTVSNAPITRDIVLGGPSSLITSAFLHLGLNPFQFSASARFLHQAVIHVTPAPATLIPLVAALGLTRRRR